MREPRSGTHKLGPHAPRAPWAGPWPSPPTDEPCKVVIRRCVLLLLGSMVPTSSTAPADSSCRAAHVVVLLNFRPCTDAEHIAFIVHGALDVHLRTRT